MYATLFLKVDLKSREDVVTADTVAIGPAARALGLEPHVLRHWEDVGVLVPERSPTGHRRYDDRLVTQARLILLLQRAGFSLAQIRNLYLADREERIGIVAVNRSRIADSIAELQRAEHFLTHTLDCRHPVTSVCTQCAEFAAGVGSKDQAPS
jgi:DNA-binding transcriptional MerR regulator